MKIEEASTLWQLFAAIREAEVVKGSRRDHGSTELWVTIVEVMTGLDTLNSVTRTDGLRAKVAELLDRKEMPVADWFLLCSMGQNGFGQGQWSLLSPQWPMEDWPMGDEWGKVVPANEAARVIFGCTMHLLPEGKTVEKMAEYYISAVLACVTDSPR